MDIHLLIYLILAVAPIGTFLHEAGHAVGAKMLHATRVRLSLGSGRAFFCRTVGSVTISIHTVYFLGGLAYSERKEEFNRFEKIWIAVCGPLCNLITSVLLFVIYYIWPVNYILLPLLFNLWIAFINLIPFKIKGRKSDGYIMLKVLTRR